MLNKLKYLLNKNRDFYEAEINKQQLEKMIENRAVLLDIRSPQEFEEGHLQDAILLPEYELSNKANIVLPEKQQYIVVYCNSGGRSRKAQKKLRKMGYNNVYNLKGGLENYN